MVLLPQSVSLVLGFQACTTGPDSLGSDWIVIFVVVYNEWCLALVLLSRQDNFIALLYLTLCSCLMMRDGDVI